MDKKKHFNIKIYGKVQGVFYRAFCKEKAIELNLNGFVKNMEDGSVYIEVEGDDNSLAQFLIFCNEGPKLANVKTIIIEEKPLKNFTKFEIKK